MSTTAKAFGPRVAVVGAGKTGRGFVGRLLVDFKVPFILIDADYGVVEKLRKHEGYLVDFFTGRKSVECRPTGVFHVDDPELPDQWRNIDVVFVSIGASRLEELGRWLPTPAPGKPPVPVVLCENAIDPAASVRRGAESAGFNPGELARRYELIPAAVFCTTMEPVNGGLDIVSEEYDTLECRAGGAECLAGQLPFLSPQRDFDLLMRRKIYTYNAASAVIAYPGWWMGHATLAAAVADRRIAAILDIAYREINRAISSEYGVDSAEQETFARRSREKFANPLIVDSVERNVREPLRKLGPDERMITPALLVAASGGEAAPFELTAALALLYAAEVEGARLPDVSNGFAPLLARTSSLTEDHPLVRNIVDLCVKLKEMGRNRLPNV